MTTPATIVKVLIASPGDTETFRDAIELALHRWNGDRAIASSMILLPRRWETNAVPMLAGSDGQTVINSQLVDDADIVIGVFHLKLGSATPRAASGTAEELGRARDAGKPVHVYFSNMDLPRDFNRDEYEVLDRFKNGLRSLGLYDQFETVGDLADKVRRAVQFDLDALDLTPPKTRGSAALRATYLYDREPNAKGRMTTRRERIEVVNDGEALAEDVSFELLATDDLSLPIMHGSTVPFTLAPNGGTFSVPILRYAGATDSAQITFNWTEGGAPKEASHTLSFR